jgi:hypothetical protein
MPLVDVSNLSDNDPPVVDKEVTNGVLTDALDQDEVTDVGDCVLSCSIPITPYTAAEDALYEYSQALGDEYQEFFMMWEYVGLGQATLDDLREQFPAWAGAQFDEVIQNFENLVLPGDN